jgi:hypothetical protein
MLGEITVFARQTQLACPGTTTALGCSFNIELHLLAAGQAVALAKKGSAGHPPTVI